MSIKLTPVSRYLLKYLARLGLGGLLIGCLLACSPPFDWRTHRMHSYGDAYTLTFPGKALSAEKSVQLAGSSHRLMLTAVQVNSAQFALGSMVASDVNQAKILATALADAFSANLQVPASHIQKTPLKITQTAGAFDLIYPIGERFAQARFIWTEHAAYELLVIGQSKDLSPEIADTFIRSMQFE